jgi:hypothetical protein
MPGPDKLIENFIAIAVNGSDLQKPNGPDGPLEASRLQVETDDFQPTVERIHFLMFNSLPDR